MTEIQLRHTKVAYYVLLIVTFLSSVSAAIVLGGGFVLQAFPLPESALPLITGSLFALIFACQMVRWRLRGGQDEHARRSGTAVSDQNSV